MNANDNSPQHYEADYQHWDWTFDNWFGAGYCMGAATKYIVRAGKKDISPKVEDLAKAKHYTTKLLEMVQSGKIRPSIKAGGVQKMVDLKRDHNLSDAAAKACELIAGWKCTKDLDEALYWIDHI